MAASLKLIIMEQCKECEQPMRDYTEQCPVCENNQWMRYMAGIVIGIFMLMGAYASSL